MNLSRRIRRSPAIVLVVLLAVSSSARAQTALTELSIEDLIELDAGQVFGASERLQPVTEAPASVSFITAEQIARYGYRTLADILSGVRGLYVTNNRNFSLLGARGFGNPGDYNSRILLLVNGHRVNDNVFGQAEIGAEFGLDPAVFERVEVIRGPASSLYGDSAFFLVVNVITKTGAALGGGSIAVETGTLGTRLVRATAGRRLSNGVEFALSGTYEHSDGAERLYFPAFDTPATNNGIAQGLDGEGAKQFYGRVDFNGLTITGAYGTRRRDVPTASNGTLFNSQDPREQTTDRHTLLDAQYGRPFRGTRVTVRASFDRFSYDGTYPLAGDSNSAPPLVDLNGVVGTRWTLSGGMTRALPGRQIVRAGVEFIDNVRQEQTNRYVDSPLPPLDIDSPSTQHAIYVQDEIKLGRWWIVNAGLRYDGYEQFTRVTPRTALIFLPSATQSLKYLYGNAFRAPNGYELNAFFFGARVTQLRPESIDTHELVWESYVNDWLRTSVSGYWYKADHLITQVADASTLVGVSFINHGQVRAKGLELEAQMRLKGESRALISYALQSAVDQQTDASLPNSPHHVFQARITFSGPTSGSTVSVEGRYLSGRDTVAGSRLSGASNLNVTWIQPFAPAWELFTKIENVLDDQYSDPVSDQHLQDAIPQNGRTARIGLRRIFKAK